MYLLQTKADVQRVIPNFFAKIKTQFGQDIKGVSFDNAKELFEKKVTLIGMSMALFEI